MHLKMSSAKWWPFWLGFHMLNVQLYVWHNCNAPWASYQIRKIAGCACAGNAGNVFPRRRFQRKLLVSDPGMHHGTCVTHVPWCMSGSLTCGDGENVPGIPGACAPAILRIWQEAHSIQLHYVGFTNGTIILNAMNFLWWRKLMLIYLYNCCKKVNSLWAGDAIYLLDLSQHWLRSWLVPWWHQSLTWTNIDIWSMWSNDKHPGAITSVINR